MNKTIRRGGIFLALAAVVVTLTACSTYAAPDQIILYYKAGTGDQRQFGECIQPGQSGSYPVDDEIYALPTSLRTWNIRPKGGDTADPIASGTLPETVNGAVQPGPEVVVYATADFYLNSDCKAGAKSPIVRFWESTGRRYGISADGTGEDGDGGFSQANFNRMLLNTLVPAEETALRQETRKYDADALDANTNNVWTTMERNLAPTFQQALEDKLGGKYFCGTGFAGGAKVNWTEWQPAFKNGGTSFEEPELDANGQPVYEEVKKSGACPPVRITITDVNFRDPNIVKSRNKAYAAEQEANAKRAAAQGDADAAAILNGAGNSPGYVRLQEIEAQKQAAEACKVSKNCTVIIGDPGNTSLPVGGR